MCTDSLCKHGTQKTVHLRDGVSSVKAVIQLMACVCATHVCTVAVKWASRQAVPMVDIKHFRRALCQYCVLFAEEAAGKGSHKHLGSLVTKAYTNWKNALEGFSGHAKTSYHQNCSEFVENFLRVAQGQHQPILNQLSNEHARQDAENRVILGSIVDTIILCGRQELDFRSKHDAGTVKTQATEINDILSIKKRQKHEMHYFFTLEMLQHASKTGMHSFGEQHVLFTCTQQNALTLWMGRSSPDPCALPCDSDTDVYTSLAVEDTDKLHAQYIQFLTTVMDAQLGASALHCDVFRMNVKHCLMRVHQPPLYSFIPLTTAQAPSITSASLTPPLRGGVFWSNGVGKLSVLVVHPLLLMPELVSPLSPLVTLIFACLFTSHCNPYRFGCPISRLGKPMRVIEVIMEQHHKERVREMGEPRENQPTSGIVRHSFHMRKSRSGPLLRTHACMPWHITPAQANLDTCIGASIDFPYWMPQTHVHSTSACVNPVGSHGRSTRPLPLGSLSRIVGELHAQSCSVGVTHLEPPLPLPCQTRSLLHSLPGSRENDWQRRLGWHYSSSSPLLEKLMSLEDA
ncbi:hypothetical protein PR048_013234 [Dryococelus australis]|uniref:Uncharacterized protein n=1 Tax=Dryococelus australis TaxID=614101 RepID=A0ABQ9HSB7_9NEOP|nr:hypothetical protein PR048_013234 [Dryococelus australis]